jgi:hypothetical protein
VVWVIEGRQCALQSIPSHYELTHKSMTPEVVWEGDPFGGVKNTSTKANIPKPMAFC